MDEPELDHDLRHGLAAGDADAFEALVDHYQSALIRYAWQQTGDRERAEDVVQEAFVALVRRGERILSIDSLGSWLFRVTRNRAIDLIKKESRMRQREGAAALAEVVEPVTAPVEVREEAALAIEQLRSLDARSREVILLKVREGRSYREISTITGLSLGQVSKLIHQGLARVARCLRAEGATKP